MTKIDTYAFGMMIYELLVGDKPWIRLYDFSADNPSDKWFTSIKDKVMDAKRPEIDHKRWDKSLVDLMVKCWDQDPSARPTARQIYVKLLSLEELERLALEALEIRGATNRVFKS